LGFIDRFEACVKTFGKTEKHSKTVIQDVVTSQERLSANAVALWNE